MSVLVVIPARWGSTRLPGKPLRLVAGRTLLARVIDLARRATRGTAAIEIVVACDDERVASAAKDMQCRSFLTDPELRSGSDRALAAALRLTTPPGRVVNLQGDAPFTPPTAIRQVISALLDGADVATPVIRLNWQLLDALRSHKQRSPFSGTTAIVGADGEALWFSKQIIPAIRDEASWRAQGSMSSVFQHLGLYGYRLEALKRFAASPVSAYEQLEGLEQLRLLALRIPIRAVEIEAPPFGMSGIDTPDDLAHAEQLIAAHGDPFGT